MCDENCKSTYRVMTSAAGGVDRLSGRAFGMQVWFETSQHTGRVHFHLQEDGSQPLGLSIPMDQLIKSTTALVTAASAVNPLLSRISDALSARQATHQAATMTRFCSQQWTSLSLSRHGLITPLQCPSWHKRIMVSSGWADMLWRSMQADGKCSDCHLPC